MFFTVVAIVVLVVSIDIISTIVLLTCIIPHYLLGVYVIDLDIVSTSTLQGREIGCGSNCIQCKGAVTGDIAGAATCVAVSFTCCCRSCCYTCVAIGVLVVSIDITSTVVLLTCISSTIRVRHFCYRLQNF